MRTCQGNLYWLLLKKMTYIVKPKNHHPLLEKNELGLTRRDYEGAVSTLCAGCGHDSISSAIVEACFQLSIESYKVAKLSGIGCSSKAPAYFLNQSHGFNSVHGRMPSIATGAAMANHELLYLGISGDGDSASIGIGQFVHCARRQLNMTYIVENNGTYGLTKGHGEKAIEKTCKQHFILRTNFFGWGPKYRQSFSDYIINSLKSNNRIKLYKDVFYTPIEVSLLSELILRLFSSEAYGIYNASGSSRISKFDFGKLLASAFNLPKQLIDPVLYNNMNYEVPRPHEMSLSNQKICETLGIEKNSLSIEASISRLLLDYQEHFIQDIRQL